MEEKTNAEEGKKERKKPRTRIIKQKKTARPTTSEIQTTNHKLCNQLRIPQYHHGSLDQPPASPFCILSITSPLPLPPPPSASPSPSASLIPLRHPSQPAPTRAIALLAKHDIELRSVVVVVITAIPIPITGSRRRRRCRSDIFHDARTADAAPPGDITPTPTPTPTARRTALGNLHTLEQIDMSPARAPSLQRPRRVVDLEDVVVGEEEASGIDSCRSSGYRRCRCRIVVIIIITTGSDGGGDSGGAARRTAVAGSVPERG